MMVFSIICLLIVATFTCGFHFELRRSTSIRSATLQMKVKTPSLGNIPRKLKRKIRSVEAENFDQLYTAEFDSFLKTEAQGSLYDNIIKKITKRARHLNITLRPDFGVKPEIILPTIVEQAVAAGTFQKLVAAVTAAGLVDTLSDGSYTVLAPSDIAFAKLGDDKINELLADIPTLTNILKYHVLPGVIKSKKFAGLKDAPPEALNEKKIGLKVDRSGEVTIDGAKIVTPDLKCRNGMIHVIDTVLIPK